MTALADDTNRASGVMMRLDGVEGGQVRATFMGEGSTRTITIATNEPVAPVLALVRAFLDGKGPKSSALVLSTDAVVQKASGAHLTSVRLPGFAGGSNDVALTFDVPQLSTTASLRVATDRARTTGRRMTAFRLTVGDLPSNEATRLDALVLKAKDGGLLPQVTTFDIPSKDSPPFLGWLKRGRALDASIEYVGALGETAFGVKLTSCTASSVRVDGPVTHVALACARARS